MACGCTTAPVAGGTVPLEDFLPYVQMYVPGCPEEIIAHAIRLEAIEFSRATHTIRRTILVDAQAHVHDYCLEVEDDYRIAAIERVCVDGLDYLPTSTQPCGDREVFRRYFFEPGSDLMIYDAPAKDGAQCIHVTASVQPGQDSCRLDKVLYDDYAEAMSNGAISRLMLMPETKWFNQSLAGVFMRKSRQHTVRAKNLHMKGASTGPLLMKTRRRFV